MNDGISRRRFLIQGTKGLGAMSLAALGAGCARTAGMHAHRVGKASRKPNIIVILADDLGYGDTSCYGAEKVVTPNIDRLAHEGVRFTDAHSPAAICTPTRYGLLTGRYAFRRNKPWNREELLIDDGQPTVASVLKSAGYATGCVGKWHVGFGRGELDWNEPLRPGPLEVGFDYYFGSPMSHNEPPFVLVENDRVVNLDPNDPVSITEMGEGGFFGTMLGGEEARFVEEYLATQYVDKAETFIRQNQDEPFFLYLPTNNVHVPLTPHPRFQGQSDIGIYGDYILELDWLAGRILSVLDELGIADDTLVIFTSDNGAVHFDHAVAEGHLANGPLLGQKTDAWEGGHRVPFLARWPGVIKANSESDDLVCLTDLLATTAAVAGVQLPEGAGPDSFNVLPALLDERVRKPCRETLLMTGIAGEAVRDGKWLYIPKQGSCGVTTEATDPWWIKMDALQELGFENSDYGADGRLKADAPPAQLYDLSADPGQTTNLFEQRPDVAEHMQALLVQIKKDGRSIR